jgi:hypothetical protein
MRRNKTKTAKPTSRTRALPLLPSLPLVLLAAACTTVPAETSEPAGTTTGLPDRGWTEEFFEPAVLLANEIRISGPPGLMRHFAMRADEPWHTRTESTTPDGYVQEVRVRDVDLKAIVEIRGYLDRMELVALRGIRVLERVSEGPVVVEASGDVFYSLTATGESQREQALRLVGEPPR